MTRGTATFFSYAREDSAFALRLARDLRQSGIEVWIDQLDIAAGKAWDRSIQEAIESCGSMLIVLSPHSVESENVMDEVAFALDEKDRVVPVLLEPCDVPLRLRRLQYIDFTQGYEPGLKRLTAALAAADPAAPVAPVVPEEAQEDDVSRLKTDTTSPDADDAAPPAPGGRTKAALIAASILVVVALLFGLAQRSKSRPDRRQTSIAGTNMVVVPNVIGVAKDRAVAALGERRLTGSVEATAESCQKPAGTILRQDPPGMTQAKAGSEVRLIVAERTPIPLPNRTEGATVLAPGAGHAAAGRQRRPTRVEFMLAGDPCAAGTVSVSHPAAGNETYTLKSGDRGSRNIVYGDGKIIIRFESLNRDARLVVRTD